MPQLNGLGNAVEPARAGSAPARQLKGARRSARERSSSAVPGASGTGALEELNGSAATLQARVTYELYSGNPRGGTDGAPGGGDTSTTEALPPAQEGSTDKAAGAGPLEARVICELYGGNAEDDTDAQVTFSVVESPDASADEDAAMVAPADSVDPNSGNPRGGTDASTRKVAVSRLPLPSGRRHHRSVVVAVHIPRGAATPRVSMENGGSTVSQLMRTLDAKPAANELASPT
jgi:hypothetical protein